MSASVPHDLPPAPTSPRPLAVPVAGVLMLGAALMLANPYFGSASTSWPWEVLQQSRSPLLIATWSLWLLTGVLALVVGRLGSARWRAPLLAGPALVLLFTCHSHLAGLRVEENSLFVNLGVALLLAGFLLQSAQRAPRSARWLSAVGGLLVVWTLACAFDYGAGIAPRSQLAVKMHDLVARLTGGSTIAALPNYDDYLFATAALVGAALVGLLAAVGLRGVLVGRLGIALSLAAFCVRPVSKYVRALGVEGFDALTLAKQVSEILIPMGFALAWLAAAVLADLARGAEEPA